MQNFEYIYPYINVQQLIKKKRAYVRKRKGEIRIGK